MSRSTKSILIALSTLTVACDASKAPVSRSLKTPGQNDAARRDLPKDPTLIALYEGREALMEESSRLSKSAEKYPKSEIKKDASLGLSDVDPSEMMMQAAQTLAAASDDLGQNSKDIEKYMSESVKVSANGTMEIPAIKKALSDAKSLNDKLLADAQLLNAKQGSESATIADLNKRLSEHETAATAVKSDLATDGKAILDAVNPQLSKYEDAASIAHLRNFTNAEANALLSNLDQLSKTLREQSTKFRELMDKVNNFRSRYALSSPSASIQNLKKALADVDKSREAVQTSVLTINSSKEQFVSQVDAFRLLIEKAKVANDLLGVVFEDVRSGAANSILAEVSKLEGARDIIVKLIEEETRANVKESLQTVRDVLMTSITNLNNIAANLKTAMSKAQDLLADQRRITTDQNRITVLQDEYLSSISLEQKRIADQLAATNTYDAVKALLGQLEDWAVHAQQVGDRNEAAIKASVEPLNAILGGDRLRNLADDAAYLSENVSEALRTTKKNLRLLRVADAARADLGLLSITHRKDKVWVQLETLTDDKATKALEEAKPVYTSSGVVKDLIVLADEKSSKAVIRFSEQIGDKQLLVVLFGSTRDVSTWIPVVLSENYRRQSQISVDREGRTAVAWQDNDGKSYMQLFDHAGVSIAGKFTLQEFPAGGFTCNNYTSVALSVTGNWGIVNCISAPRITAQTKDSDIRVLYRRFTKQGTWIDPEFILSPIPEKYYSVALAIAPDGTYIVNGVAYGSDRSRSSLPAAFSGGAVVNEYDTVGHYDTRFYFNESQIAGWRIDVNLSIKGSDGPGANERMYAINTANNAKGMNFANNMSFGLPGIVSDVEMVTLRISEGFDDASRFRAIPPTIGTGYSVYSSALLCRQKVAADYENIVVSKGRVKWSPSPYIYVFPCIQDPKVTPVCGGHNFRPVNSQANVPLLQGEEIKSCNGRYMLKIMPDGTLAHFKDGVQIWNSGDKKGVKLVASTDGKVQLVDANGTKSDLATHIGVSYLVVSDAGYVTVVGAGDVIEPLFINDAFTSRIVR